MGLFGNNKKLQSSIHNLGEPCASPLKQRAKPCFYRGGIKKLGRAITTLVLPVVLGN